MTRFCRRAALGIAVSASIGVACTSSDGAQGVAGADAGPGSTLDGATDSGSTAFPVGCITCPAPNAAVCDTFDRSVFTEGAPKNDDAWGRFVFGKEPDTLAIEAASTCGSQLHVHLVKQDLITQADGGVYQSTDDFMAGGTHIGASNTKWQFDFDVAVATDPNGFVPTQYAALFVISEGHYAQSGTFQGLAVGKSGFAIVNHVFHQETYSSDLLKEDAEVPALAIGTRAHVRVLADFVAKTFTVTVNDSAPVTAPMPTEIGNPKFDILEYDLGVSSFGGTPDVDARFDNFSFVVTK